MNESAPSTIRSLAASAAHAAARGARLLLERLWARFPKPQRWSLRLRFFLLFCILALAAWLVAAGLAWWESRRYIDEFFDTQQMLFAKRLASADFSSLTNRLPGTKNALRGSKHAQKGKLEDDALAFAVFSRNGTVLLTDGQNGEDFVFDQWANGFVNTKIYGSDDLWRIVWLTAADGERLVAVGQELDYREDMAFDMLQRQLVPWILFLPVVAGGMLWMLSRELAPLRSVARKLESRAAEQTNALDETGLPSEVLPLVSALNSLFLRIADMMARERAFISDAAHELRTPLTALRVQAEVAGLAEEDADARRQALDKLLHGIDRCSRLMEQLLTLSRLESMQENTSATGGFAGLSIGTPDWPALLEECLQSHRDRAAQKGIAVEYSIRETPLPTLGYPALITLVLRNLLDNAIKYTPAGGRITISLDKRELVIGNSGLGVPDSFVPRLGERFARPPGHTEPGSGLGLSIAKRAAALNNLKLALANASENGDSGFTARVILPQARQNGTS